MPNEASPSTSSSKNAKDDSDSSTATQAIHESKHTDGSQGGSSHGSSEKDSGFSDTGSDWQLTSAKNPGNQKQSKEIDELPPKNEDPQNSNNGNGTVAPPTQQLPSLYIIKNMPHIVQKNGQLLWSSGNGQNVPGANPVILLHPPHMLPSTTLQLPKAGICKSNVTGKNIKSYPRIAPHPHKKSQEKTALSDESLNQRKRVCTEHKLEEHVHKKPEVLTSNTQATSSGATGFTSQATSSTSSLNTQLNKNSIINTRHRRFANTVQVLKQSGLLDITMRTKDLMCQSNATTREVAQLRQHSELLCQLADNSSTDQSPNNMAPWLNLHRIMSESGCYPDLKGIQALQVPATHQELNDKQISVNNGDDSGQPVTSNIPPHVPHTSHENPVPQLSQIEQRGKNTSSDSPLENDSDTAPDSSTD